MLHAPPVVPDYRDSFIYTSVVPQPYAQLAFSYGNSIVTGTAIIVARTASTAASFFEPPLQSGITDAFVTFNLPNLAKNAHFVINVGAFSNRYGTMGEYDEGRYGTPIIGRTNGVGENVVARFALGDLVIAVEQGFQGQLDKPPVGLAPDGWNGFADPNTGTGLVHHEHIGIGYRRQLTLGLALHAGLDARTIAPRRRSRRTARSRSWRAPTSASPAATSATSTRRGAYTDAERSRSVGRIIEVLNTEGGPGPDAQLPRPEQRQAPGSCSPSAGQYDLSLARLLLYPEQLRRQVARHRAVAVRHVHQASRATTRPHDGVNKLKFGGEGTYTLASRGSPASLRLDHVRPTSEDDGQTFSIISPRLIFRSDWQVARPGRAAVLALLYGDNPIVRSGYPAVDDPGLEPDEHVVSLSASMWW